MKKHGFSILLIVSFIVCTFAGESVRVVWTPNPPGDTEYYQVSYWLGSDTTNEDVNSYTYFQIVNHDSTDLDHFIEDSLFATDYLNWEETTPWLRVRGFAVDTAGNSSGYGYSRFYHVSEFQEVPPDTIPPPIPAGFGLRK